MIIWINGAYGSGKSTTAGKIQEVLTDSIVFDAEEIGNAVRNNMEKIIYHVEFPDYAIWREFVAKLIIEMGIRTDNYILIPMTVLKEEYMQEILGEYEKHGLSYKHFILDVDSERIGERIVMRGEGTDCWCYSQKDRCLKLLAEMKAIHIDGTKAIDEVAHDIIDNI